MPSPVSGAVFSFGCGEGGCLGHGDMKDQILPKRIEALGGVYVATVAEVWQRGWRDNVRAAKSNGANGQVDG